MNKSNIKSLRWHKRQMVRIFSEVFDENVIDAIDYELDRLINKANDMRLMKVEEPSREDEYDQYKEGSLYTDTEEDYELTEEFCDEEDY